MNIEIKEDNKVFVDGREYVPKGDGKEWEVVAIKMKDGSIAERRHYDNCNGCFDMLLKTQEFPIHSVKRLSDGEVFTVGEGVIINYLVIRPTPINNFKIQDGKMYASGQETGGYGFCYPIKYLVKLPSPKKEKSNSVPLTITEGVNYFPGQREQPKKRIEVTYFDEQWSNGVNGQYVFESNRIQKDKIPLLKKAIEAALNDEEGEVPPPCHLCGGSTVMIRGKYPKTPRRNVCAACNTERLEQIQEISNSSYGQTSKNC